MLTDRQYNTVKMWRIAFFALNNAATNLYFFAIGFVSYYATGIAGLSVVVVSIILTAMRAFDAITDPIFGFILDKTESKFGKFRPFIFIGNLIMAAATLVMYHVTHTLPSSFQFVFFVLVYAVFILGFTFQATCTRGAQTVLTNHPKQRPLFSIFDSVFNLVVFVGGQIYIASYLVPKYGGFQNQSLFTELNHLVIVVSAVCTILAIIGIWSKDRKQYYGLADNNEKVKFKDFWSILKTNRPLQMLTLSASSDKLASTMTRQPAISVMFFGIMIGDYALSGTISLITFIPSIAISLFGVAKARKIGLKKAFVLGTWIALISFVLLSIVLLVLDPSQISLSSIGLVTILFIVLFSIGSGFSSFTGNMVIPMIADVADYETYRSGRYVPGMMGTLFSLIDKMVSSLAPALVGFALVFIGYRDEMPQIGEELTTAMLFMTLFLKFGVPMIGWIVSIVAMKFYPLDANYMEEIQKAILKKKNHSEDTNSSDINVYNDIS